MISMYIYIYIYHIGTQCLRERYLPPENETCWKPSFRRAKAGGYRIIINMMIININDIKLYDTLILLLSYETPPPKWRSFCCWITGHLPFHLVRCPYFN